MEVKNCLKERIEAYLSLRSYLNIYYPHLLKDYLHKISSDDKEMLASGDTSAFCSFLKNILINFI